ncbi:MAG TPA: histidine kinase [Gemmatimonadaceae bacterium]|nr:histidine kinase [Gemmatimonadaceae bacterium]
MNPRWSPHPAVSWRTVFGAWTVIASLAVLDRWASARVLATPPLSWRGVAPELSEWYLWALFTPGILRLGKRFPVTGPGARFNVVVHLAALLGISAIHAVVYAAAYAYIARNPIDVSFASFAWRVGISFVPFAMIVYSATVAIGVAASLSWQSRADAVRTAELTAQLARAETAALRAHLHPHFLFNSLHTVGSLVRESDRDAAVDVIAQLGDLLRELSRQDAPEQILLREELAFVRRYLAIERVRFEDRLRIVWRVSAAAEVAWVPRLLLQPLVENAIRHGIATSTTAGLVEITATQTADTLTISVRDDGPGPPQTNQSGVGLATTRARLAHTYGSAASLTLAHAHGGGAVATARLPYLTSPPR